ncbi:MAG TPA: Uma2 family endonuclease [Pirellulales bacterium]
MAELRKKPVSMTPKKLHTRRQELVLEGELRLPLAALDFKKFRQWRASYRFPGNIKASYLSGMVCIETGINWSMHYGNGHAADAGPPPEVEEEPCFCIDGCFYVPHTAFELEGFRDWVHSDWFPEKVKATFIDGSIEVDVSPEELESHGKLKVELVAELRRLGKRERLGDVFTDSSTVVMPPADFSTEPDIVFCSWEGYRSGRVKPHERVEGSERFVELVGAPDLVVELVSRSSVSKDRKKLRNKYWQAGIPEYWLIDARGKKPIRFQLLTRGDAGYEAVEPDDDGYRYSPTFERRFKIVRRINPVGRFDYRLLQRKDALK